ncbi:MAG TPA: ABC transporter permease, partial [Elusimicrobiota bacterium]|nr:ABC transporter permease [Elusimicrobiota bacterium]
MVTGLLRKLPRDLWTLRAQTAALAALVLCGVAVLVSSWSSYRSLQAALFDYYNRYRMAELFAEVKRAPNPLLDRLRALPGVDTAETRLAEDVLLDVPGQPEPALGHFVSLPADGEPLLNRIYLRGGRAPRAGDPPEVLVHEAFAQAHRLKAGD